MDKCIANLHIALAPFLNLGLVIQPRGCRCPHAVGHVRDRSLLREGPVGHQSRGLSGSQKRTLNSARRVRNGDRRLRERKKVRLDGTCDRVAGDRRRRGGVRGTKAAEGGVRVAARHFGVEELALGTGGPEGGSVRAPEHLPAIGGVGVEAVGTPIAARNIGM